MKAEMRARVAGMLRWGGWGVVLSGTFLRAMVGIETLPHWDADPTQVVLPLTGLTPLWSQAVDVAVMAGAGLTLAGEALAGFGVSIVWTVLVLAGAVGVGLHAAVLDGGSAEHARLGSTWVAAMVAGLAGMHVCRDERVRRVTIAGTTGLLMMLVAKGVLQMTVEHAATVAQYRADPDAFLASQGWVKGSAAARSFERRLMQPEATGWFGLANVYASFAAGGLVSLTGWALLAWRKTKDAARPLPDGWAGVLSLGAVAAAAAVWMAGSKGGTTAAGIGLALLAGRMLLVRREALLAGLPERAGGMLAVALVLSALAAVVFRGMIGERMGELSLLFRWFYMEGAVKIFATRPGIGVGPGGFKDAYMLAKPALSPEEVQSPHSVMLDFAATLGTLGLAWTVMWMGWVYALGRRIVGAETEPGTEGDERLEGWFVVVTGAVALIGAVWVERAVATPDAAVARGVGMVAWVGASLAVLSLARRTVAWRWAAALGALMIAVHGQIEVTPVWAGSTCLAMVMLAASGARPAPTRGRGLIAGVLVLGVAAAWGVSRLPPAFAWEGALASAAERVSDYANLASRVAAARDPRARPPESMQGIAADLGRILGSPPAHDDAGFARDMDRLLARSAGEAADELFHAMAAQPRHMPTVEAYCRMRLAQGAAQVRLADPGGEAALDRALEAAQKQAQSPSAGAFGLLGNVWSTRAELLKQPELLSRASEAWTKAAAMDPYGPAFALRVFRTERDLGHKDATRQWAQRVLERDKNQRLDDLKRLTPEERDEVERALKGP